MYQVSGSPELTERVGETKDKEREKVINLMRKMNAKKVTAVIVLLVVMILSMTVVSKVAGDPENHRKTIESLDEKKEDVLKLTATSAAASTALAAIPGDATTPVANKLADLTSYFLIILMVVFLEKYLVTLTGYAAFTILIPIACVLLAAGICANKAVLKMLAAKIALFAAVIFLVIPFSMKVSSIIEETYEVSMEATVKEAEDLTDEINENTDSEGNIIEKALSKIKDGVTGLLEKGEQLLNQFIETIAVMLVTSCLIPILVLVFMLWFIKMLFGIQINVPKDMPKRIASKVPGQKKVAAKLQDKAGVPEETDGRTDV